LILIYRKFTNMRERERFWFPLLFLYHYVTFLYIIFVFFIFLIKNNTWICKKRTVKSWTSRKKKERRPNIGWTYGRFQWGQIGEMAIKSNLIESSRASLCCVGAACNPDLTSAYCIITPTYGIPYSIWIVDWEVGRPNDPGTIFKGRAYFKLHSFLRLGKDRTTLYLRKVWYTILLRAIWPIRQFTKGLSKLLKRKWILPSTYPLRIFFILQCLTDCSAIYGTIIVAVVVNNK